MPKPFQTLHHPTSCPHVITYFHLSRKLPCPVVVVVDLPLLRVAVEGSDNPISLEKPCQASLPPDQQRHNSLSTPKGPVLGWTQCLPQGVGAPPAMLWGRMAGFPKKTASKPCPLIHRPPPLHSSPPHYLISFPFPPPLSQPSILPSTPPALP